MAQIISTEDAYKQLDAFLVQPTPKSSIVFSKEIALWEPVTQETKLAKVISLCNLGYYQMQFSKLKEAISSYEEAKHLYISNKLKGFDMMNACYIELGNLYAKTNAFSEAENTIREYLILAQKNQNKEVELKGIRNLSTVYKSSGRFQEAINLLKKGLQIQPDNNGFLTNLANNYFEIDDIENASIYVEKLITQNPTSKNAQLLKARLLQLQGKQEEATSIVQLMFDQLQNSGDASVREMAKLCLTLAELELANPNDTYLNKLYSLLLPSFNKGQVLPLHNQLYPETTLVDALDLHAAIFIKTKQYHKAVKAYQLAQETSNMLHNSALTQESRLLQQTRQKARSEKQLSLLFDLYTNTKDSVWLKKAIAVDQQSKSPILIQERKRQQQLLSLKDPSIRKSLQQIKQRLTHIQTKLLNTNDKQQVLQLQEAYNITLIEHRQLMVQLDELLDNNSLIDNLIDIKKLQIIAKEKEETIVSYFIGKEQMFQFIISGETTTFNCLATTQKEINEILQYHNIYVQYFENASKIINDPLQYTRDAHQLYKSLNVPKAKKIMIVPDGILGFVPFNSLITKPTNTYTFSEMPLLLYESQISYALSINEYLTISEEKEEKPNVIGVFPVFKDTSTMLKYSINEARGIDKEVDATLLMNEQATVAHFLELQKDYNTVHISTHAVGGTFTSPATIAFSDRDLTIDELYGYQFNKDLVVLSACETGVGKVIKGEGTLSIARGFQYAGANNVLFSLWKVNDQATANLMIQFYNYKTSGASNASALHQSMIDYVKDETIDNTQKSPYYWSSFVYYGNNTIDKTGENCILYFVFLGLVIAVIFILVKHRIAKK